VTIAYGEGATDTEESCGPSLASRTLDHNTASRNFFVSGSRVWLKS